MQRRWTISTWLHEPRWLQGLMAMQDLWLSETKALGFARLRDKASEDKICALYACSH